jgi:FAD/FMN-containing dehydrogenase
MTTYEDLVAATLPHGLMPLVVPQLRTITLGGAVTGLGIEASSFRSGLPHESVLEAEILTGDGEIVVARAEGDHADLFRTFPNSYGSLGYALSLTIELEPVHPFVALQHVRFESLTEAQDAIGEIMRSRAWDGEPVDFLDGVVFSRDEIYLTLGRWADSVVGQQDPSDYTGQQVFYRSLQQRERDVLTIHDYLWRWDTDWFWCSRAFGAQHPVVRRLWPRRWKRSDVYYKMVGLDQRLHVGAWLDRRKGNPEGERVVQDVEIPVDRLPEFLDWFDAEVGMRPVWLCPLVASRKWPTYPLAPHETYVNVGFWGNVPVGPDAPHAPRNRAIEAAVHELGGHKSLYSEAFYDRDTFDQLYDGAHLARVKERYDPDHRLTSLYDKAVRRR